MQQPCQRKLSSRCTVLFGRGIQRTASPCKLARRDWEPGDEAEIVLRAVIDHVFVLTVAEVVLVLHADDFDHLARLVDFMRLHFGQADVEDLALLLQLLDGRERFFDGHLGIDAMKLPEIDALDFEAAEAHLDLLLQIFRPAQCGPLVGSGTHKTPFGGDDETLWVGMERFRDDLLADVGPVGVRGVDEVNVEFDLRWRTRLASARSLGSPQMPSPVRRMAPNPRRWTGVLPPRKKVPLDCAEIVAVVLMVGFDAVRQEKVHKRSS